MRRFVRHTRDLALLTALSAWRGVVGFYTSENLTHAASISYYALLSLFPFSMLALAILGSLTSEESDRSAVLNFVLRYFPRQFDFITIQLDAFRSSTTTLGLAGSLGLIWGALGFFGAITTAVNHAWRVEKARSILLPRRPIPTASIEAPAIQYLGPWGAWSTTTDTCASRW